MRRIEMSMAFPQRYQLRLCDRGVGMCPELIAQVKTVGGGMRGSSDGRWSRIYRCLAVGWISDAVVRRMLLVSRMLARLFNCSFDYGRAESGRNADALLSSIYSVLVACCRFALS